MTTRARKTSSRRQWRAELIEKLEALHMLTVEADAFHSAFETVYGETSWPSNGDPERRRALNRMSCFSDELNRRIDALLRDSQEVVEFTLQRPR